MSEKLNIVDISQIVSGVSAAAASIFALITTIQNRNENRKSGEERHAMVKPIFIARHTSENRLKSTIDFDIKNIGYDKLLGILVLWKGTDGVSVDIVSDYENKSIDYVIKMDYKNNKNKEDIKGKLVLKYTNILGKQYTESIEILIKKEYNDIMEQIYPILKEVIGENFV